MRFYYHMSEFSDLLSQFIHDKNIKVYSMVRYCNMDRSTMYKIINGKRNPPSPRIVDKIAEFMHLTPPEYEKFQTAYQITVTGRTTYYKRKSVGNFILTFPRNTSRTVLPPPLKISYSGQAAKEPIHGCTALSSQLELNDYLHRILIAEANKENGRIALFLQPDYDFLFGLLASLKSMNSHLYIEHILCLSNSEQITENQEAYNLMYLRKILPIYIHALNYHPYYFYDDIHSHYNSFNGFPCMILTQACAITCTSDYKSGILYTEPRTVQMIWDLYHNYLNKCFQLFHTVNSMLEEYLVLGNIAWTDISSYTLQAEPCLIPFITPEILESVILPDLPDRDSIISRLREFINLSRSRLSDCSSHLYHTRQGIDSFAQTGRITEIPREVCRPFTVEERIYLLESLANTCSNGIYRLLKKPLDQISDNLHLSVNTTSGYLLFTNVKEQSVYLIIKEPGILSDFLDYAESLDDSVLSSAEETVIYLRNIIRKLKDSL